MPVSPFNGSVSISNNPNVGNTLQIVVTDPTLNGGNYFFADQAAQYGIGSTYGNPNSNLFVATYQWYANGTAINGAINSTFKVTSNLLGEDITVRISYTNGNHLTGTTPFSSAQTVDGIFDYAANISTYVDAIQANLAHITGGIQVLDGATQFRLR